MKLGISIYSISRKIIKGAITPQQAVEWLAKDAGAQVIEIVPFGIDLIANENLAEELKNIALDNGSLINNYSLNANFLQQSNSEHTAEFERIKLHIDSAAKLGIATMRIDACEYRRNPEDNIIENFIEDSPEIVENYEKLCDYARQYNIIILLENHGYHINGADRIGSLLYKVKNGNFSHQLDAGNFLCIDEIPEVAAKRLIKWATTIHMKDFYVRGEDNSPGDVTQFDCSGSWFRSQHGSYLRGAILGQGDMNMKAIVKIIKDAGFDGCIYLEFEGMEDCFYGTKVGFENMKKLFWESDKERRSP